MAAGTARAIPLGARSPDTQNNPIWTPGASTGIKLTRAQIGGSARGYRELSVTLATPTMAGHAGGRPSALDMHTAVARSKAEALVARADGDQERARRHEPLARSARQAAALYAEREERRSRPRPGA